MSKAIVTLAVFIFIAAGVTQALFLHEHAKLNNFVDAMYYVVTSLTTTGYGAITLDSIGGRLFMIVLMITGISLSIAQKAFAPQRKPVRCTGVRHGPPRTGRPPLPALPDRTHGALARNDARGQRMAREGIGRLAQR